MIEIKYDIIKNIAVIREKGDWNLELNYISWNDKEKSLICENGIKNILRCQKVLL